MDVTENDQPLGISSTGAAHDLPVMERRRWLIKIVCSSVTVVTLVVALRLFSRRLMRQKIWWDDYFIIVALVNPPRVSLVFLFFHSPSRLSPQARRVCSNPHSG